MTQIAVSVHTRFIHAENKQLTGVKMRRVNAVCNQLVSAIHFVFSRIARTIQQTLARAHEDKYALSNLIMQIAVIIYV